MDTPEIAHLSHTIALRVHHSTLDQLDLLCARHLPRIGRPAMIRELIARAHADVVKDDTEARLALTRAARLEQLATKRKAALPGQDVRCWKARWIRKDGTIVEESEAFEDHRQTTGWCASRYSRAGDNALTVVEFARRYDGTLIEKPRVEPKRVEPEPEPELDEPTIDFANLPWNRDKPPRVVKYWQIAWRASSAEPYHVELFVCDADAMAYSRTLPADVRDVEFLEPL